MCRVTGMTGDTDSEVMEGMAWEARAVVLLGYYCTGGETTQIDTRLIGLTFRHSPSRPIIIIIIYLTPGESDPRLPPCRYTCTAFLASERFVYKYHANAAYTKGYSHPETIRLVYMNTSVCCFTQVLTGHPSAVCILGLTILLLDGQRSFASRSPSA